jgi:hypothetical protein
MKRGRTSFPIFYNPTEEDRKEKLTAHRSLEKHIKKQLLEFAEELSTVSKWLRLTDKTNDPRLQRETSWEKYHRTQSNKLEGELLRRLRNVIDNKKLNVQDKIDKELYHRIRDLKTVKGWYQEEARNPQPKRTINYSNSTELDWLVFGSDEGLDVKDDPMLNAFMVGFHCVNKPPRDLAPQIKKLLSPQAPREELCEEQDVPIPQVTAKTVLPLINELKKEVKRVLKSLTQKQRTALILVLIEKNSYEQAGKKSGVNKKTIYERLWGKNNQGGAIDKIKKSAKLKEIAGFFGYKETISQ